SSADKSGAGPPNDTDPIATLRVRYDALRQAGQDDRSAVLLALLRQRTEDGLALSDHDVFSQVKEWMPHRNGHAGSQNVTVVNGTHKHHDGAPESETVTQKHRDTGDSGDLSKSNETHRGGEAEDSPPPVGVSKSIEEEDRRKSLDERLP